MCQQRRLLVARGADNRWKGSESGRHETVTGPDDPQRAVGRFLVRRDRLALFPEQFGINVGDRLGRFVADGVIGKPRGIPTGIDPWFSRSTLINAAIRSALLLRRMAEGECNTEAQHETEQRELGFHRLNFRFVFSKTAQREGNSARCHDAPLMWPSELGQDLHLFAERQIHELLKFGDKLR